MAGITKGKFGHMPGTGYVAIDSQFPCFTMQESDGGSTSVLGTAGDPGFNSRLTEAIGDADLVVIVAGMGGKTGTAISPLVARIAKGAGALVLAFVTTPYSSEGVKRNRAAEEGVRYLKPEVDNMVVISNDCLLRNRYYECTVEPFADPDSIVSRVIANLMRLVMLPAEVNIDYSDLRRVIAIPGRAAMCEANCRWRSNSVVEAAKETLMHPLAEIPVTGAKGLVVNFWGNDSVATNEYREALEFLQREVNPQADCIFGISEPEARHNSVRVTLFATGI